MIELSGDEADAAAVTPAPKKKKKAKRELPPAPCVCGVIAKGVDRRIRTAVSHQARTTACVCLSRVSVPLRAVVTLIIARASARSS